MSRRSVHKGDQVRRAGTFEAEVGLVRRIDDETDTLYVEWESGPGEERPELRVDVERVRISERWGTV